MELYRSLYITSCFFPLLLFFLKSHLVFLPLSDILFPSASLIFGDQGLCCMFFCTHTTIIPVCCIDPAQGDVMPEGGHELTLNRGCSNHMLVTESCVLGTALCFAYTVLAYLISMPNSSSVFSCTLYPMLLWSMWCNQWTLGWLLELPKHVQRRTAHMSNLVISLFGGGENASSSVHFPNWHSQLCCSRDA